MGMHVFFYADDTMIKRSGDGSSFIFNSSDVFHLGQSFQLNPQEKLIVIPVMPNELGPWKQSRSASKNGRLVEFHDEEQDMMAIKVINRWPLKKITVSTGISLARLLATWGIFHEMSHVSQTELETIPAYSDVQPIPRVYIKDL